MKIILIISILLIYIFSCNYINEIKSVESIVYELYQRGFNDYLIFIDEETLSYDKESLQQHIERKGYKMKFFEGEELHFCISFKKIFVYQKEFKFELVKNDGF